MKPTPSQPPLTASDQAHGMQAGRVECWCDDTPGDEVYVPNAVEAAAGSDGCNAPCGQDDSGASMAQESCLNFDNLSPI